MTSLVAQVVTLLLALSALSAAFFGYGEYRERAGVSATAAIYDAALTQQKAQAAQVLASAVARVRTQQTQLDTQLKNQDTQDAKNKQTVATLNARVRSLADAAGRLRDPNAAGCGRRGDAASGDAAAGAGDSSGDAASNTGVLSTELSGLFLRLTEEADAINLAYASCRADALSLRAPN